MPSSKHRHVAVLIETDDTWGRRVVASIAKHAHAARWTLLIGPRDKERRLRLPKKWKGDGAIVSLRDGSMARHVREAGMPAVDVSITMPDEKWLGRVATDDDQRARLAFEHLRSRGLERFACYSPPIGRYPGGRAQAFARVVREAGFDCPMFTQPRTRQESGWLADYTKATKWLARLEKPLAVFASDPYPARQLVEICDRNNTKIPDEVAIISGDSDELLCNTVWPQITSIELASHRIGKEACVMLEDLMCGAAVKEGPVLLSPLRVLPQHSTDVLAIDDPEFTAILRVIREQATQGLTIDNILRDFPVSRRGLELKFRRYLDVTPAAEIRRVRLQNARQLLLETDRSIDSIAIACGFSGGPSLSHCFRKEFGITPGQLRAS